MENLGERISYARKAAKLSATDLARLMDKTPSTISQYESEKIKIGLDALVKVSEICQVDLYWLITGKGNMSSTNKEEESADTFSSGISNEKVNVEVLEKIKNDLEKVYLSQIELLKSQLVKSEEEKTKFINILENVALVKQKVAEYYTAVVADFTSWRQMIWFTTDSVTKRLT
jgi:transcriptional regulator with XRE-family HTH domain